MIRTLVNVVTVNTGWFACVMGAAAGYYWLGPVTILVFFLIHLALVKPRRPEIILAGIMLATGFAADTLLAVASAIEPVRSTLYPGPWSTPWMVALWVNLGTALGTSLRWLEGRTLVSVLLGAVSGPSAYASGAALDATTLGEPRTLSLVLVGVAWAVVLPLAVSLAARLRKAATV